MSGGSRLGLFVAEGSSDMPISDLVEELFFERGVTVHLSRPDFNLLGKVPKDVRSRVVAGRQLTGEVIYFIVVHRDADSAGTAARRNEIQKAWIR